MTIDDMIQVLQAAKAGKEIQSEHSNGEWKAFAIHTWLKFQGLRVKPEPRVIWAGVQPNGELSGVFYPTRSTALFEGCGEPIRFIEDI